MHSQEVVSNSCGLLSRMGLASGFLLSFLLFLAALSFVESVVASPEQHDVRIVVDISGSMKKSDPKNLRRPAVNLIAQLLPKDANAGVWTFGRFVNMLVPIRSVDTAWREQVKRKSQEIDSIALYTNIPEALERVSADWSLPDEKTRRSMIFLTDGKVDVSKDPLINAKARQEVLSRIIPKLRQTGAQVHTIALSEDVDVELLRALSYQTNGQFQVAMTEDDLVKVFMAAFDASVPQQEVPLGKDNAFEIDSSVQEFTALVYKRPGAQPAQLRSPSGVLMSMSQHGSGVRWYIDESLEVVTVSAPEVGMWQLQADIDPGNRVTVISDLSLKVSEVPNYLLLGQPFSISVYFEDDKGTVTNREFLSLLDLDFEQHYIDGNKTWEGQLTSFSTQQVVVPENGEYVARLKKSLLPGRHEIRLIAKGRTFERKISRVLTVIDRVVEASLTPPKGPKAAFSIIVKPIEAYVDSSLTVKAKLQGPRGQIKNLELPLDVLSSQWVGQFEPFDGPGKYQVGLIVTGQSQSGTPIDNKIGPLEAQTPTDALGVLDEPETDFFSDKKFIENSPEPQQQDVQPQWDDPKVQEDDFEEPLPEDDPELMAQEEDDVEADSLSPQAQAQEESLAAEESFLSSPLGMVLLGAFVFFNLALIGISFFLYRRASLRKAKEDAEDDARLAQLTAAEMETEADTQEEALTGAGEMPSGVPTPPELSLDDDDEPPFDPDRIS